MLYQRFGKTELQMPVITSGGMRFQMSWGREDEISDESQSSVEQCIRRAIELGITHIETARAYGTSERQVGRVISSLPREEIILQTKIVPNESVDAAAAGKQFLSDFDDSLEKLQTDYVDLLALHGLNDTEVLAKAIAPGGALDMAEKLKKEGRARHIGFSTHGPCDSIQAVIATDRFDYVNLHWFWSMQERWPAVLDARAKDMGVFIISPNDKGGRLYEPSDKLVSLCDPISPMVWNDAFCLLPEQVHTISCGASKPTDYDEHIKAVALLESGEATTLIPEITNRIDTECRCVLGDEWWETWHVGLPDWSQTPGEIHIPGILRLYNLAKGLDMVAFAKERYGMFGAGHWFPGKRAEDLENLDLSPCLKNSPHADKIPAILAETHEMLVGKQGKRLQVDP